MSFTKPIYFDYAASTPVDPRVAKLMAGYLTMEGCFGNPASNSHIYGMKAKHAVEQAREQAADFINADAKEIVWTSGATASDNLALKGAAQYYRNKGRHIITSRTEHKAVLDTCKYLERCGFEVTYLTPEKNGLIDIQKFKEAIREDTILASIMHVNNELGVIQDIAAIGAVCRQHKIIFHVDAAQSVGKVKIDLRQLPVDLMSFSGHKIYGPKGIGALYVRRKPKVRLVEQMSGGGHENGMRSGTLATHQIIGMGEAFAIAKQDFETDFKKLTQFKKILWDKLSELPDVYLNGSYEHTIPGILNFSIAGVEGTALLWAVNNIAVSTGSACTSAAVSPSFVLSALGVPDVLAHSTLRLSMGRFTKEEEVHYAAEHIVKSVRWLRNIAPAQKSMCA